MLRDQFPLDRQFKNGFVYFAPAITYTAPFPENETQKMVLDTTFAIQSALSGKIAYGIEVGWYHSFENPIFFHYLEGGINYRVFKGSSQIAYEKRWQGESVSSTGTSSYSIDQVGASFRAIRAPQIGKYTFLTFGPGINFDYHLSDNRKVLTGVFEEEKQEMKLQLHFQFGLGIRMTESLIFLPQVEIPLAEAYPTGKWYPMHDFAQNNLYPVLFQFKFILLRKDLMNCNAPSLQKQIN